MVQDNRKYAVPSSMSVASSVDPLAMNPQVQLAHTWEMCELPIRRVLNYCRTRSTSGRASGDSRLRTTGGPPLGEALERKYRDTEKVEHGGEANTAAYSQAAQRCKSLWYTESRSKL
eukprot:6179575-Pleurochrysis_carterae.AAC.2